MPENVPTSPYDTYTSPLSTRNASPEMCRLWSPRHKFQTWRKIWLAVAEAQRACGLAITDEQLEQMRSNLNVIDEDFAVAEKYEAELRHDVMAHVHTWGDRCPKARPIIHLGMTSQDVVCNADLLILTESLILIRNKCLRVTASIADMAELTVNLPILGYTHYQAAQPLTLGRRIANWASDLLEPVSRLQWQLDSMKPRGLRGATGTQASFVQLVSDRTAHGNRLERMLRVLHEWNPLFDGNLSEYVYKRTVERVILSLHRKDKLNMFDTASAMELLRESGVGAYVANSTYRYYFAHMRAFCNDCRKEIRDSRQIPAEVIPVSASTWTAMEEIALGQLGFVNAPFDLTGQTYPRVVDSMILSDLASISSVLHKIATDIRLLSNRKEIDEPFGKNQIGSSAMPYKRNPMKCERICGLTRFVMNLVGNAYDTAATQWLERTLDDSSNRRLSLPEAFLALDGALDLMHQVASGLVVNEAMVRKNLMAELPFLATENIMMEAVKAGGDRQDLHEKIRVHAQAAGHRVKQEGLDNDLIERLRKDPAFKSVHHLLTEDQLLDPMKYVGRSVEQTERFLREVVEPLRERYADELEKLGSSDRGV